MDGDVVRKVADGVILSIRLRPKASDNSFGPPDSTGYLKAKVTAVPENGKANKALVKMLAKQLRVAGGKISVASGATNRDKQLLITGDSDELFRKITTWIGDINK